MKFELMKTNKIIQFLEKARLGIHADYPNLHFGTTVRNIVKKVEKLK